MRYVSKLMVRLLALWIFIILLVPSLFAQTQGFVSQFGVAEFTVPASQYLNVFCAGTAKVYKQVGGPASNSTPYFALETNGTVTGTEVSFGPYTSATVLRVEAFSITARYSIGALAAAIPCVAPGPGVMAHAQPAPVAQTVTVTLLASDLAAGIITGTQSSGATAVYTLPTGTLTDAAMNLQTGESFDWTLINLSSSAANTITVAAGSGHTLVGNAIVGVATSAISGSASWRTKKTAANTFVTYRLN